MNIAKVETLAFFVLSLLLLFPTVRAKEEEEDDEDITWKSFFALCFSEFGIGGLLVCPFMISMGSLVGFLLWLAGAEGFPI